MTIRPAAIRLAAAPFFNPIQVRRVVQRAANDNAARVGHDPVLRDALKHFAKHGLAAAEIARQQAELAFFSNDRQAYGHWLSICRTLDRRMAAALEVHAVRPVALNPFAPAV